MGRSEFKFILIFLFLTLFFNVKCQNSVGIYKIGTGIGDVTGPAAGVVLNGYVNPLTLAAGVHTRLHARSFIVESITTGKSVVFVSCDLGMLDHGIKLEVIKKLRIQYGEKYTEKNVQISSTHTHSGPSGYMQYYAYLIIESYGFNPLSFWAIVNGIVDSIEMAHERLANGRILKNKGELLGYNGNRRGEAYLMNPEAERELYKHNVDKEMILLRFETVDSAGNALEPIGCFTWWPVHPISFNNWDNPLVSSDSRGFASVSFDYEMNKGNNAGRPGRGKFVAAFAAANLGDVSPRTGPERLNVQDEMTKVGIVGTAQFKKAFELFNDKENLEIIKGPVNFVQQYADMTNIEVTVKNPATGQDEIKTTCKSALGYSFIGLDPDQQKFWDPILHLVKKPSAEMVECQKPKIVAIAAGEMAVPWDWAPSITDLQILRVGNVDIVSVPGEFTTMSGRRLRRAIEALVPENHEVIIAGLANNYINYISTPEEYDFQEYEAGATIFGKYTLNAIIQTHQTLVTAMNNGIAIPPGPTPPNFIDRLREKIPDRVDVLPINRIKWGEVVSQPRPPASVYNGHNLLVIFVTPSLRHDAMRNGSHFLIQRQTDDGKAWEDIRTDADLDTTFWWDSFKKQSEVKWHKIPDDVTPGTYRVYHSGFYLENAKEDLKHFEGVTEPFEIVLRAPPRTTPVAGASKEIGQRMFINIIIGMLLMSFIKFWN